MSAEQFKKCPKCGVWFSIDDILECVEVSIIGMSLDPDDFAFNNFYFNHDAPDCNTTFTMNVLEFVDFINEPIAKEILAGEAGCELHCVNLHDTRLCASSCRWAPFRRFMNALMHKKLQKSSDAPSTFGV